MCPKVALQPENITVDVTSGTTLLEAANQAGIEIRANCGGEGTCGRCKVRVDEGRVDRGIDRALKPKLRDEGYYLSCQARVTDEDIRVFVPVTSRVTTHKVISAHAREDEEMVARALMQGYR